MLIVLDTIVFLKSSIKTWWCPKKLHQKKWRKDLSWLMFKTSRDSIVIYLCFRLLFLIFIIFLNSVVVNETF